LLAVLERHQVASKPVCQLEVLHKAEQGWMVGSAEEQTVCFQMLVVEAAQAGLQVVTEAAEYVGSDSIGSVYYKLVWIVQNSATVAIG